MSSFYSYPVALTLHWVGLQCVMVFPDHTLLFSEWAELSYEFGLSYLLNLGRFGLS